MAEGTADALDLVGGHGDADAGGAEHNALLTFSGGYSLGGGDGKVGVVAAVGGIRAEILAGDPLVFQIGFQMFFQRQRSVVTSQCDHSKFLLKIKCF